MTGLLALGAVAVVTNNLPDPTPGIESIAVKDEDGNSHPLVGKPAPDFILPNHDGKLVSLADLGAGKPVVLFMSAGGGCGTCMQQIVRFNESDLFAGGTVGVASLVSGHTDSQEAWHDAAERYPELRKTAVLIDTHNAVVAKYGADTLPSGMGHGGGGVAGHSYIVIDKEGIVRLVADDPMMGDWTAALEEYLASM